MNHTSEKPEKGGGGERGETLMIMGKERANGEGGASSAGGTCWLDGYKPRAPHPPAYNKKMDSVRARRLLGDHSVARDN